MKKVIYSGAFKALVAAMLFFCSIAACIYGFLTLRAPLLYQNADSVTQTKQYSELFMKYIERTAVYVRYLEDGYSLRPSDYSPELSLLLDGDKVDQDMEAYLLNVYEPSETAFYYYHTKLNCSPSNYRYYVQNTESGVTYASAGFLEYACDHSGSLETFLSSGILSESMYLIMNTKNNRTMTGGGNETVLTRSNLLWSMDFLRRPLSDMAEETVYGYNYQKTPEVTITLTPNPSDASQWSGEAFPDHAFLNAVANADPDTTPSEGDKASSEDINITLSGEPSETLPEKPDSYLLYAFIDDSLAEDDFSDIARNFAKAKQDYDYGINYTLCYIILTVLLFFLCHIVSGHRAYTDKIVFRVQDKLFTEVTLAALAGLVSLPIYFYDELYVFFRDFVSYYPKHTELLPVIIAGLAVYLLIFGLFYFSLVRKAKGQRLLSTSFVGRFVVTPLGHLLTLTFQNLKEFCTRLPSLVKTVFQLLLALLWLGISLVVFYASPGFGLVLILIGVITSIVLFIRNSLDYKRIQQSTMQMSEGNLAVRIETDDMLPSNRRISDDINHICDGLHSAVMEQTKSERMKTELITNVSHDIKTPLTSIINFIELLKNELPNEGPTKEYAEILSQKSWRLKALIDDLVEASKASSGTIHLEPITFNISELIRQVVGDFEERLTERSLTLCLELPDAPVNILADGACTHRIIENLFSNVCKYALPGTRVFVSIDLPLDTGLALLTIKNVSSIVLNKSSEELLTRFTRGDDSRSDEGSGLGLSIAESLARLQGGSFYIELDGDLFKAKLTIPLAKDSTL